jgi:hypothetical protein
MTYKQHGAAEKYKATCQENITPVDALMAQDYPSSSTQCQDPKEYMPWWYVLVAWPEGIAAWGLLFTLGAIIWQSYETRKAAEATQASAGTISRSVTLQEAQLRQWVDVKIIGSEVNKDLTDAFGELVKDAQINLRFKAINETSLPLTIVKIVTKVSRRRIEGKLHWEVFEVDERVTIPPSKGDKESSHPFFVFLDLNENAVRAYQDQTMVLLIIGDISIENATGDIEGHSFGKAVRMGGMFITELPFEGTEPIKVEG